MVSFEHVGNIGWLACVLLSWLEIRVSLGVMPGTWFRLCGLFETVCLGPVRFHPLQPRRPLLPKGLFELTRGPLVETSTLHTKLSTEDPNHS